MRTPNQFINPATGATYSWAINHHEESEFGRARAMQRTAPSKTGTGLGRQQGEDSPMILQLKGVILQKAQLDTFISWYALCETQTIYFQDFAGERYEVIITSFKPTRRAVARNHQDLANMPLWVYDYTMEMEVVRALIGPWAGVAA
jgi:hypothetical protein